MKQSREQGNTDRNQKVLRGIRDHVPAGYLSENLKNEIVVRSGRGCFFTDCNGKRYLDLTSGIFTNSFGHCFPPLIWAALRQNLRMDNVHGRRTEAEALFYDRLSSFMPDDTYRFIPYNDGGYAVDRGLSDIVNYFGKERIPIGAFRGGFHGKTMGAKLAINETKKAALYENFQMDYPFCYRCPFGFQPEGCSMECADRVCRILKEKGAKALLFEPIQGAGIVIPPRGFWKRIEAFCRKNGILLFADEVLTAGGRTGSFLASYGYYRIRPDLIAVTKGLANGHPLSVLCEREPVTENIYAKRPGERSSTFAAHPEALAIAAKVLSCLRSYHIFDNVRVQGELFLRELNQLREESRYVGDVRAIGLMGAIEFVRDGGEKQPFPEMGRRVFELARQRGVEVIDSGHILRLAPPLNIDGKTLFSAMRRLRQCVAEAEREYRRTVAAARKRRRKAVPQGEEEM